MVLNGTCWGNLQIPKPILYQCGWLDGALYKHDAIPSDDNTTPVKGEYCDKVKCPLFARLAGDGTGILAALPFPLLLSDVGLRKSVGFVKRKRLQHARQASVLGGRLDGDGTCAFG